MSIVKTTMRALTVFALASATACLSGNLEAPDEIPIEETTFATALGVNLSASTKTPNGAYYRDIVVGTGAVIANGDSVSIRYTGWLSNGVEFDNNLANPQPLTFKFGFANVIQGLDEGLVGARVGSTRQLIIPPYLAYGPNDYGPIPGQSVLVFRVEVVGRK
jgi:FKBP-type peptidyl-prolyl cis-trans isomerase